MKRLLKNAVWLPKSKLIAVNDGIRNIYAVLTAVKAAKKRVIQGSAVNQGEIILSVIEFRFIW